MIAPRSVSAAIFAGGKSTRFGSPKINAQVDGVEFGFRIIRALREADISTIKLIGGDHNDAERWNIGYVADEFVDAGPVGALVSALRVCTSEVLLILPCDVPYINNKTCSELLRFDDEFDVNVAFTDSAQWLCSSWRVSLLETIEEEFEKGVTAIHVVAESLRVNYVNVDGFALQNINEQSDLARTIITE